MNPLSMFGVTVSAFGDVSVTAVDFPEFRANLIMFTGDFLHPSVTVDLLIDDQVSEDWEFFAKEFSGQYEVILRHPRNETIGTAEYVRVQLSDDGEELSFIQKVVVQNDNDDGYAGMGMERFGALRDW